MSLDDQLGMISWESFEEYVRELIGSLDKSVLNFEVAGKRKYIGAEGEYEIDASFSFELLGVNYLTLIECKNYKSGNTVSRDLVLTLNQKMQSIGAQKGIIFTTSDFQRGAIEFAQVHGIALIKVCSDSMAYITKGHSQSSSQHVPASVPKLLGYIESLNEKGQMCFSLANQETMSTLLE